MVTATKSHGRKPKHHLFSTAAALRDRGETEGDLLPHERQRTSHDGLHFGEAAQSFVAAGELAGGGQPECESRAEAEAGLAFFRKK